MIFQSGLLDCNTLLVNTNISDGQVVSIFGVEGYNGRLKRFHIPTEVWHLTTRTYDVANQKIAVFKSPLKEPYLLGPPLQLQTVEW
jgi:hypothetical protein